MSKLGVVVHACNLSIWEAEAGAPRVPGLYSGALSEVGVVEESFTPKCLDPLANLSKHFVVWQEQSSWGVGETAARSRGSEVLQH